MSFLKVHFNDSQSIIKFTQGLSIREILESADIRIKSGCRGTGACGLCKVKVISGVVSPLTHNEKFFVSSPDIRLACQTLPLTDADVEVLSPAPKSDWHILNTRYRQKIFSSKSLLPDADKGISYRVAVDLGTTNIMISVLEMPSGRWIGGRSGLNPQYQFGLDIITRLMAASESQRSAYEQQKAVFKAINEALKDIADREILDLSKITNCTIVGNTAMITLMTGCCCNTLLDPSSWGCISRCVTDEARKFLLSYAGRSHETSIDLIQPFAGFVGSDLLAGIFAVGISDDDKAALFIDFGTNTEIALWDGKTVWVASASGGPAFEASGISCGMPAAAGAVCRVSISNNGGTDMACEVINNTDPQGICGSGLVDLMACLLKKEILDCKGRLDPSLQGRYLLTGEASGIYLTSRDVDMLQRAKAGIAACIALLCSRAGVAPESLSRVCIAGAFGRYLDIKNAQAIGLMPMLNKDAFELWENAALIGCEMAAISSTDRKRLDDLRNRCKIINMSNDEEYEPIFFENLHLSPMSGVAKC